MSSITFGDDEAGLAFKLTIHPTESSGRELDTTFYCSTIAERNAWMTALESTGWAPVDEIKASLSSSLVDKTLQFAAGRSADEVLRLTQANEVLRRRVSVHKLDVEKIKEKLTLAENAATAAYGASSAADRNHELLLPSPIPASPPPSTASKESMMPSYDAAAAPQKTVTVTVTEKTTEAPLFEDFLQQLLKSDALSSMALSTTGDVSVRGITSWDQHTIGLSMEDGALTLEAESNGGGAVAMLTGLSVGNLLEGVSKASHSVLCGVRHYSDGHEIPSDCVIELMHQESTGSPRGRRHSRAARCLVFHGATVLETTKWYVMLLAAGWRTSSGSRTFANGETRGLGADLWWERAVAGLGDGDAARIAMHHDAKVGISRLKSEIKSLKASGMFHRAVSGAMQKHANAAVKQSQAEIALWQKQVNGKQIELDAAKAQVKALESSAAATEAAAAAPVEASADLVEGRKRVAALTQHVETLQACLTEEQEKSRAKELELEAAHLAESRVEAEHRAALEASASAVPVEAEDRIHILEEKLVIAASAVPVEAEDRIHTLEEKLAGADAVKVEALNALQVKYSRREKKYQAALDKFKRAYKLEKRGHALDHREVLHQNEILRDAAPALEDALAGIAREHGSKKFATEGAVRTKLLEEKAHDWKQLATLMKKLQKAWPSGQWDLDLIKYSCDKWGVQQGWTLPVPKAGKKPTAKAAAAKPKSKPKAAADGDAEAAAVVQARIVGFFVAVKKPTKIKRVPDLMKRFRGKEAKLIASLEKRFGCALPPIEEVALHERLIAYFQINKPSKVDVVDKVMKKVPNEAKLRALLHKKYGSHVV